MSTINPYDNRRIKRLLEILESKIEIPLAPLSCTAFITKEPVPFQDRMSGTKTVLTKGQKWGDIWDCAWMHFTSEIPASCVLSENRTPVLLIDVNGEGLAFTPDGIPFMGLTRGSSSFPFNPCVKKVIPLSLCKTKNGRVDIWVDCGCNDLFGYFKGAGSLEEASIGLRNEIFFTLYHDMKILHNAFEQLPEDSIRRHAIFQALLKAANCMTDFTDEEAVRARSFLQKELNKKGGDPSLRISAIGHAHIDLAWLWPIRETIRKGARTFTHSLRLMERYPDYKFGESQPQLYQWIKDSYPTVFEEVRKRVAERRWEVQGAMWVEPDTNVPSGESLVRQIIAGTRFWKDEFGVTVNNLWLPDVFGYSAALPQILKKSGIDFFVTQKISWNEVNTFPHHTYWWEGIDGTRVLAHMPPEATYNGCALPEGIRKVERNFAEKGISEHALMLYGIGDGGGGPGEFHEERLNRLRNLEGFSPVEQRFARDVLEDIRNENADLAVWKGELYLENHRGTYTTQADNKRYNRKMEIALRNLEYFAVLAEKQAGIPYPAAELDAIWKEVLLYQFHDILPGSSIIRVYQECLARYAILEKQVRELTDVRVAAITGKKPVLYNTLSKDRSQLVTYAGQTRRITVPALGAALWEDGQLISGDGLTAAPGLLENQKLRAEFDRNGALISLFDKVNGREALAGPSNLLNLYDDSNGDAWNIRDSYPDKKIIPLPAETISAAIENGAAVLTLRYTAPNSVITQKIRLESGSDLLIFDTDADWHEKEKMLRTSFLPDVYTDDVVCDIQFGHLRRSTHRNTSWDTAKFEICIHKWCDLNDGGYGVALLNDCKYGIRAENNFLELNLLRSPHSTDHGDIFLDQGRHFCSYALCPHAGNTADAGIEEKALEFNMPLVFAEAGTADSQLSASFARADAPNIELTALKRAEDRDGTVLRFFETFGRKSVADILLPAGTSRCFLCSMTEEEQKELPVAGGKIHLDFHPFEIFTIKVR